MAQDIQIIQNGQSWYVITPAGRMGPLDTEQEAQRYARLLQLASAAGSETACTEEECQI
jgi:hypothetical protein